MVIPFFVVDRPVSLEILKGFFAENLNYKFGILTHAFVSKNFKKKFKEFPYSTFCRYCEYEDSEDLNKRIGEQIIKMVDSGIFIANRNISYEELFDIYEYMNADYGIIVDFLKNKKETLKSAEKAMRVYIKGNYKFKLVAVAQGRTKEEYLECYERLQKMGYQYIAIGGLLKRNGNSNYLRLQCENSFIVLLKEINKRFDPKWIFALGVYHPNRHKVLEKYKVWGADYKGWIFDYEEDYSFIKEYLSILNIPEYVKGLLIQILENYNKAHRKKNKALIKLLKGKIESILQEYNLSLQFFRFKRIRENLKRNIILKNYKNFTFIDVLGEI